MRLSRGNLKRLTFTAEAGIISCWYYYSHRDQHPQRICLANKYCQVLLVRPRPPCITVDFTGRADIDKCRMPLLQTAVNVFQLLIAAVLTAGKDEVDKRAQGYTALACNYKLCRDKDRALIECEDANTAFCVLSRSLRPFCVSE